MNELAFRDLIGRGTRGAVWRAERRGAPGRVVAVKLLDPSSGTPRRDLEDDDSPRGMTSGGMTSVGDGGHLLPSTNEPALERRLLRLRQAAAALRGTVHPALVPIEDVGVVGNRIAVVMPYVAGGSLPDVLVTRANRRLPSAAVARLGADVAGALAASHQMGLHHGALSPQDILFDTDGRVLLGGVGLADALRPSEARHGSPPVRAGADDVRALARLLADLVDDDGAPPSSQLRELLETTAAAAAEVRGAEVDDPVDAASPATRLQALLDAIAAPGGPDALPHPRPHATAESSPMQLTRAAARTAAGAAEPRATMAGGEASWLERLDGRNPREADTRSHGVASRRHAGAVRDRSARDERSQHRPRAARVRPARSAPPRRLRPVAATAAATVVGMMVVSAVQGALPTPGSEPSDPTEAAAAPTSTEAPSAASRPPPLATEPSGPDPDSGPPSVPRAPPEPCPGTEARPPEGRSGSRQQVLVAGIDDRGCGLLMSYHRGQLRLSATAGHTERYEVTGVADDAVLLAGDWDCDGREGIALYLPASGETLRFDRLPEPGGEVRAVAETTGVLHGVTSVQVDAAGCAELVVSPP